MKRIICYISDHFVFHFLCLRLIVIPRSMDEQKEECANSVEDNSISNVNLKNQHMIMRKRGRPRKCNVKDHEDHEYYNNNSDQKESDRRRQKAAEAEESIKSLEKELALDFQEPVTKRLRPRKGIPRRAAV